MQGWSYLEFGLLWLLTGVCGVSFSVYVMEEGNGKNEKLFFRNRLRYGGADEAKLL